MLIRVLITLVPIVYVLCRSDSSLDSSKRDSSSSEEELIGTTMRWENLTFTGENSTLPIDNSTEIERISMLLGDDSTTEGPWWNITGDNSTWRFDNSTSFSPPLWSLLPSVLPVLTLFVAP